MSNQNQQNSIFTTKQIDSFAGFFSTLQKIHKRLLASGYKIENGKIVPPKAKPAKI